MSEQTDNVFTMPVLPLKGIVIYPKMQINFDVVRPKSVAAIEMAMEKGQRIFLLSQQDPTENDPDISALYTRGCVARIRQIIRTPEKTVRVLADGLFRADLIGVISSRHCFVATVMKSEEKTPAKETDYTRAYLRTAYDAFCEYANTVKRIAPDVMAHAHAEKDLGILTDFIASNVNINYEDKQEILEENDVLKRAKKLLVLLQEETKILKIENDIQEKVNKNIEENQRDYYLREQMRVISEELGDADNPQDEAEEYRDRIFALGLETETEEKLIKEAYRLFKMPPGSHEATIVRTYLDTALSLPWNKFSKDRTDINKAAAILEHDHYGLKEVKERILEFMASRVLAPEIKGQIICLIGPPGVGKTSIAKSIARCMGKNYVRLSLGGVKDEADIRGHRKTYLGAMPGRIINAMIKAGTQNPLILMDEIDKLGSDYRGDPSAALLEVLDSEQNNTFTDHFMEIPYDLSNVTFVLTANRDDTIPSALFDRMEVIELGSYTREEKFNIAKKHLLKKQVKRHGLKAANFHITDAAIYSLIDGYTRESGVRNLEREISSVCRKAAKIIASGDAKKVTVKPDTLKELLGTAKFKPDKISDYDVPGLVNGLAWTTVGGEIMQIEAAVMPGTGKITLTGSLGDVMQESAKAAVTYIRTHSDILNVDYDFYKNCDIHIHATEGAVPKDGPSAGVTMTSALVSALTGTPIRRDVAMTGEVTILGRVLPIGGLKEKTMAAYKYGIKRVIIPAENVPDLEKIDPVVREKLEFVAVESVDSVLVYCMANDKYLRPVKGNPAVVKQNIGISNKSFIVPKVSQKGTVCGV